MIDRTAQPGFGATIEPGAVAGAILAAVAQRAAGKSLCPSEVARALDRRTWRAWMPVVREAALALVPRGLVRIAQGGQPAAAQLRGAIRLSFP